MALGGGVLYLLAGVELAELEEGEREKDVPVVLVSAAYLSIRARACGAGYARIVVLGFEVQHERGLLFRGGVVLFGDAFSGGFEMGLGE